MKDYIEKSLTYGEYERLIDDLLAEGKTTGPNQSDAMVAFTRLNRHRMERLAKTVEIDDGVKTALAGNGRKMIWLILTEGWCGDAAQNLPVIEKIAALSDQIETRYLLRDENIELMNRFLTNGAKAIPELIALDAATFEVLGSWGARPESAQQLFETRRDEGIAKPQIMEELQRWYNNDKTRSLQKEFVRLIKDWGTSKLAEAHA